MDVWSLASGSSGNCYLVRSGETLLLIEAGIRLSRIRSALRDLDIDPARLTAILVTHEHSDHVQSARQVSQFANAPVYATPGTLAASSLRDSPLARPLEVGASVRLGEIEVLPFRVPHDASEPVGFRLFGNEASVCLTTDLGFIPADVQAQLVSNDLLIVESNHDEGLLQNGPYPEFLKRRVLGQFGHLSNEATAEALGACGDQVPPRVWLAHLSNVNNTPARATRVIGQVLAARGLGHVEVEVAGRDRPSLRWSSERAPSQLDLL